MGVSLSPALSHGSGHVPRSGGGVRQRLFFIVAVACASLAQGQGQSQREHVPPDPPQTHVKHDMSYDEMAEIMGMDDRRRFGKLMLDRLEWQDADAGSRYAWDAEVWYGGDFHKVWLQTEGERVAGSTQESRLELGWDRIVSAWWNVRAGWRHDAGFGPSRDWLGAGFAGLAPGLIETEISLYAGEDGRSAARLKLERDLLLTQRLVLQPRLEFDAFGKDDPERMIGSGLSSLELGLRLRYEVRREFAPYFGVNWAGSFGETADLRRAAGEDNDEFTWVAGVHAWF
jgi:copper resistance protein B